MMGPRGKRLFYPPAGSRPEGEDARDPGRRGPRPGGGPRDLQPLRPIVGRDVRGLSGDDAGPPSVVRGARWPRALPPPRRRRRARPCRRLGVFRPVPPPRRLRDYGRSVGLLSSGPSRTGTRLPALLRAVPCTTDGGHRAGRRRRDAPERSVGGVAPPVRLPAGRGLHPGRPEVRAILGRRVVREAPSASRRPTDPGPRAGRGRGPQTSGA